MLRDNGVWFDALQRPNVHLVTSPIAEITESGLVTADGAHHDVDVLIYGTGFQASRFLTPMRIVGRKGLDLNEHWGGDARAYLGITVPDFPNLFLMYGPNTNIVVNGSIIFFSRHIRSIQRSDLIMERSPRSERSGPPPELGDEVRQFRKNELLQREPAGAGRAREREHDAPSERAGGRAREHRGRTDLRKRKRTEQLAKAGQRARTHSIA